MIIPGRTPAYKNSRITILPSSQCKKYVYDHYKLVTETEGQVPVGYVIFCRTWKQYTPYVATQRPRSDLCPTCHKNTISVSQMGNLDEEKKVAIIKLSRAHLKHVFVEQEEYKHQAAI